MHAFLLLTFLLAASVLWHVFVLYPFLVRVLARGFGQEHVRRTPERHPKVSLIFAAHDEEASLPSKLANSLALDVPAHCLEVIAVSDASADGTDAILEAAAANDRRVVALHRSVRAGKNAALNAALEVAHGEILVFTDANALLARDAIHHLVAAFADPEVGCVCGELVLDVGDGEGAARSEGLYWRLECGTKRAESALHSCLVGNGSLLAIRRTCARTLDLDVANDFQQPMHVAELRKRVVYEPRARAMETTAKGFREEFDRRVRIITRGLTGMVRHHRGMRGFRRFAFWSHKGLRWFTAPLLLTTFVTASWLAFDSVAFAGIAGVQLAAHVLALRAAWRRQRGKGVDGLSGLALYVDTLALAGWIAICRFVRGRRASTWIKPMSSRVSLPDGGATLQPRPPTRTPARRADATQRDVLPKCNQ